MFSVLPLSCFLYRKNEKDTWLKSILVPGSLTTEVPEIMTSAASNKSVTPSPHHNTGEVSDAIVGHCFSILARQLFSADAASHPASLSAAMDLLCTAAGTASSPIALWSKVVTENILVNLFYWCLFQSVRHHDQYIFQNQPQMQVHHDLREPRKHYEVWKYNNSVIQVAYFILVWL